MLQTANTTSPLWMAHTIMLNPDVPRTDEAHRSEHAHPFVSALGAVWLLMAQANVTETHTFAPPQQPARPRPTDADADLSESPSSEPSTVTIIELRHRPATRHPPGKSGRKLDHRIPVSGYWRQQPCGPGNGQRKPWYIDDHERGPDGPVVKKDRVHVLRKARG
jgi:hypothetical protein